MKQSSRMTSQILALKERYLRLESDKNSLIALLNETEIAEQVYNSNAIENSTLSLEETEKILMRTSQNEFKEN